MGRYQPFHDLPASQFAGLVKDIETNGVLLPIWVDENDKTIDGHQRRRAAAEAGVECPKVVIEGLDEDAKKRLALTLNLFRRQLSGVERSKALQELANLGLSTRRIAEAVGVSKSQVHRDLSELSHAGQLEDRPERVESADGKSRPATMPKRPPANVDPETGEVLDKTDDTPAVPAAASADRGEVDGPASLPPVDPGLKMHAALSATRADVAKWLAFDRHEQVIEAMTAEQRADYRSFVHSVWTHASATLDLLDNPQRLKAVQ